MIRVWKCGFCGENKVEVEDMEKHEKGCRFNPVNRDCITCKNHADFGSPMFGSDPGCELGLNPIDYEDEIDCNEWEPDD